MGILPEKLHYVPKHKGHITLVQMIHLCDQQSFQCLLVRILEHGETFLEFVNVRYVGVLPEILGVQNQYVFIFDDIVRIWVQWEHPWVQRYDRLYVMILFLLYQLGHRLESRATSI